tara:strand:+ start:322 stop:858 length:537 start_codon:yes stop_codon:yes gene_type:complete
MKKKIKISEVKNNPNNPRLIKDDKFKKLVASINSFPEMLEKRPIVVDEDMIVLGGNMRLRASQEAGLKEIWIDIAEGWSEEQKAEFIIKDNVGFGDWDWDILANEWDNEKLNEWGLDVWQPETDVNLDDFFEEDNSEPAEETNKIVLEYSAEDYEIIIEKFNSLEGTKENIIWRLLDL